MPKPLTAVLLGLVAAATVGTYVFAFTLDTTKDRPDTLDVEPTKGVATSACNALQVGVSALPPLPDGAPAPARLERLAQQDALMRTLVSTVRAVGDEALGKDVPAREWLADWTALADARSAYAAAGATGTFTVPQEDGRAITERMDRIGIASCAVPSALTGTP